MSTVKILSVMVCCPLSSFCVLQTSFPFMLVRKVAGLGQHCQYCIESEPPTFSALRLIWSSEAAGCSLLFISSSRLVIEVPFLVHTEVVGAVTKAC